MVLNRKFRLQQVLRVRHLQRDIAAAAAGAAAGRVVAARGMTESLLEEAAAQSFADHGDPGTFAAAVAARSSSASRYSEAMAFLEEAEGASRAAQAEWAVAEGRAKGLDRLADRHAEAARTEDLKADQAVIDEVAGRARGRATGVEGPGSLGLGRSEDAPTRDTPTHDGATGPGGGVAP